MKILLTNDDGYDAIGIRILQKKLQKYGDVTLVAPHSHMSGASVSRQFWNESKVYKHADKVYSVVGTPADAVHFGIFGLNLAPDLVVSGINCGLNIGIDTIYSGTVGAGMEALKAKVKAVAFSCDWDYFEPAEREFDDVMDFILRYDLLTNKYLLNVNFVTKKFSAAKGILLTDLAFRPMQHYYIEEADGSYKTRRVFLPYDFIPETDLWAAEYGYTSITPLKLGNRTFTGLSEMRKRVNRHE
ncbi:MAG TPA: 5'/3'-nucleotidase SurE [Candidatus Izemoplasmatales bacterium]|nr:5'/3'-nucleotidase SurE [Bacillota bacterium]HRY77624.1 5'/3'-nucleotidase SurE [Candidatus Izemoplasmatales bacterium]